MSYRNRQFWQPDVTVATVVNRNGLLLMVEELVNGVAVFNQPAGHLEPDESILHAAVRETQVGMSNSMPLSVPINGNLLKLISSISGWPSPPNRSPTIRSDPWMMAS